MATQAPPGKSAFLAPAHWPTWIGIALLCLVAWLPFRLRMFTGALLGRLTWLLARERRYITEVNIGLCFPELGPAEQAALVLQCFIDNGIGLIETATGWVRPPEHFRAMTILQGEAALSSALAQGKGILLMGAHYSTLDFGANLLALHFPFGVTYRPHRNPLFDAFMLKGRISNCNGVFDRRDIRGMLRHLKQGKILWYAPDQDYGPEQAVYAPFFGQLAATITAGSRLAAHNQSPVVVVSQRRLNREKRYVLEFTAMPASFPSGDETADATMVNSVIEAQIRKVPAQYLWMHKRFKTKPGGKPESPYIFISTPRRRLSSAKVKLLLEGAVALDTNNTRLQLASGLQLWNYAGLARKALLRRHPALQLDHLSKLLRSEGIATVTVDSIFLRPADRLTSVSLFMPAGSQPDQQSVTDPVAVAAFLAKIHHAGCSFRQMESSNLLWDGKRMGIVDPLALRCLPGRAAQVYRFEDLTRLLALLHYKPRQSAEFIASYLAHCHSSDRRALEEKLAAAPALDHNAGIPGAAQQRLFP